MFGIKNAINRVFPKANYQRCIVHKERNIMNRVRHTDKKEVANDLKKVFTLTLDDDTLDKVKIRLNDFMGKWSKKYPKIIKLFPEDEICDYFTYVKYPYEFKRMIYT